MDNYLVAFSNGFGLGAHFVLATSRQEAVAKAVEEANLGKFEEFAKMSINEQIAYFAQFDSKVICSSILIGERLQFLDVPGVMGAHYKIGNFKSHL